MANIKLIQKELKQLIKIYISSEPVEIGRFSVLLLKKDFEQLGKELNLKYDNIGIYPSAQPRESGDVEFLLGSKCVKKISVKTAVSGNIKSTFRKLWRDIRLKEQDGVIVTVYVCKRKDLKREIAKLILIYLPHECLEYTPAEVYTVLMKELGKKGKRENCSEFTPLAINDAIQFEYLKMAVLTSESVDKLEKNIQIISSAVGSLKSDVSTLKSDVAEMKESQKKLDEKIDKLLSILEDMKNR